MKTKLIQTKDYLLLIDEEAEIKGSSELSFYKNNYGSEILCISYLSKAGVVFHELDVDPVEEYGAIEGGLTPLKENVSKIIAYYPLTKEAKELDLPLLPNPFEEEPLMKQASELRELRGYHKDSHYSFCGGFIEGYRAAQSKQFSLEDIIAFGKKCFYKGFDKSENDDANSFTAWREEAPELIQSLSTQRLPVSFEHEYEEVVSVKWGYGASCDYKLKTITNLNGKEELVGVYKY